jgi:hypothetical protein
MAVRLQGRVPAQEPGAAVRDLGRSADRPFERRFRGADCGEAVLRDPARSVAWPTKRRAAAGGGRAGRSSRPVPEFRSRPKGANGRKPGCPAPPRHPERQAAAGVDVSVRTRLAILFRDLGRRVIGPTTLPNVSHARGWLDDIADAFQGSVHVQPEDLGQRCAVALG